MTDQAQFSPSAGPAQSPLTPQITPRQKRRFVLIGGGVLLFFSVYLLAFLVPDVIRNLRGPKDMTLVQAADSAADDQSYVRIEDGVWDCDTIVYVRGSSSSDRLRIVTRFTEAFLTDASQPRHIVLFATFSGEKSCDEIERSDLSGYLKRMSGDTRQELTNEARLARFYGATDYLEMCAYCGPSNSLIGTAFGVGFGVLGVVLLAWGMRMPVAADPEPIGPDGELGN